MFQRGWFLIDVRDAELAETTKDAVQRFGVVRASSAGGEEDSAALIAEPGRVAGMIIQVEQADVARLREVRAQVPCLPVLALFGSRADPPAATFRCANSRLHSSWELINTSQQLGIELAQLPVHVPNVVSFVQRALSASFLPHGGVARVVSELAQARALSAREVQILTYCLGNEPRKRVRRRLGIAENTLKTQIRSLLRKCDERSVDALAKNVLRAALFAGRECKEPVSHWQAPAAASEREHGVRLAKSA
jgi:DNA-binding NarL/FixJ family response regulator